MGCRSARFQRLLKPKFHYARNYHVTRVTRKFRGSRRHGSCYGEVTRKFFGVSNRRDKSRWFEKFPWPIGSQQPVCVGKIGDASSTRHVEVSDVADNLTGTSQVCCGRQGEVGIMEFGLNSTCNAVERHTGPRYWRSVSWRLWQQSIQPRQIKPAIVWYFIAILAYLLRVARLV